MKQIYLIRHGETTYNKQGIVQGSGIDSDLNKTGIQQAQAFYKHYGHIPFDKIYTSTLKRSMQTVSEFVKQGIPVEHHKALDEISWGGHEGKKYINTGENYYTRMIDKWKEGELYSRIAGGESPLDVAERQRVFIQLLLSREEEKTVLVCMHGRAMRILLCQLMKLPLTRMDNFTHHNAGLYLLQKDDFGNLQIDKENCTVHLEN